MNGPAELLEFTVHETGVVVGILDDLRSRGSGWINLAPDVPDEHRPPPPSRVLAVFTARGPEIPFASLVPGGRDRSGNERPWSVGLQHPLGQRARLWLGEREIVAPSTWKLQADHPRRGIVWEVPPGEGSTAAVDLVVRAGELLCRFPTGGRWLAEVHR